MTRAQKEGEGYALRIGLQHPILTCFFFSIPRCPERERIGNKISKVIGMKTIKKTPAKDWVVVFILRLLCTFRGVSRASDVARPV